MLSIRGVLRICERTNFLGIGGMSAMRGLAGKKDHDSVGEKNDDSQHSPEVSADCSEADQSAPAMPDYKDKYQRALAETENVRRRLHRQIEDTKSFAMQGFCKDLIEVADILNLALDSLEKTKSGMAATEEMKGIREGVAMTQDVLLRTFSKHGLELIKPHGEKFDPNFHDAVFEVPRDQSTYQPGHVDQVLKVGYRLHHRPIRPAKVSVVKND